MVPVHHVVAGRGLEVPNLRHKRLYNPSVEGYESRLFKDLPTEDEALFKDPSSEGLGFHHSVQA